MLRRLAKTEAPLNIIACENVIGGSQLLKKEVYNSLSQAEQEQFEQTFAFPNAAVDRIVPNQVNDDPLLVKVEPYYEWIVDESMTIGELPQVTGLTFVAELTPYIERKLFTVNTGHAICAYLGYHYGFNTIAEALKQKEISNSVEKALHESGHLLQKKVWLSCRNPRNVREPNSDSLCESVYFR